MYNPTLPHGTNSQGREQMHAKLDKMVENLSQMEYSSFMIIKDVYIILDIRFKYCDLSFVKTRVY